MQQHGTSMGSEVRPWTGLWTPTPNRKGVVAVTIGCPETARPPHCRGYGNSTQVSKCQCVGDRLHLCKLVFLPKLGVECRESLVKTAPLFVLL